MENINSISILFYSLDDEILTKMALHEKGKNLRDFCILLSVDIQIEKEIKEIKTNLVS
jgi:hypothetical protein